METKTLLARIVKRYYPEKGWGALLIIEAKGVDAEQILVERGLASDKELDMLDDSFHFVRIIDNGGRYRIDQIVPLDDYLLKAELISI